MKIIWYIVGGMLLGGLASPLYASVNALVVRPYKRHPRTGVFFFMILWLAPILFIVPSFSFDVLPQAYMIGGWSAIMGAWSLAFAHTFHRHLFLVPVIGAFWPHMGWQFWQLEKSVMNDPARQSFQKKWAGSRWVRNCPAMQQEILEEGSPGARRKLLCHLQGEALLKAYQAERHQNPNNLLEGLKKRWEEGHGSPGRTVIQQLLQDPHKQVRTLALCWTRSLKEQPGTAAHPTGEV